MAGATHPFPCLFSASHRNCGMAINKGAALNRRVWQLFSKVGFTTQPNSSAPAEKIARVELTGATHPSIKRTIRMTAKRKSPERCPFWHHSHMKTARQKGRGTTLRQYLRGEMKDPEFRRLYQEADIELRVALEVTKAREAKHMSQRELAGALKTKQQTVSRIERGAQNVTIETLDKIARALGRDLQVRFVAAGA